LQVATVAVVCLSVCLSVVNVNDRGRYFESTIRRIIISLVVFANRSFQHGRPWTLDLTLNPWFCIFGCTE